MSIEIRIYQDAINSRQKRVDKILEIQDANPVRNLIDIRKEMAEAIEKHQGDYKTLAKISGPLAVRERRAMKIFDLQTNPQLTEELSNLQSEIHQLLRRLSTLQRQETLKRLDQE